MKRMRPYLAGATLAVAAVLCLAADSAFGALGDVVGSFTAPDPVLRGLGRSTNYLYVLGLTGAPDIVFRCNPSTGSVYGSWSAPYITANRGLTVTEGNRVWISCYMNNFAYECAAGSGSVYGSWHASHDPFGLAPLCTGDGGQGTTGIFSYDTDPNNIFLHNLTNGSVTRFFPLAHATAYDFAYDHRNRLIWKYYLPNIYGYDTSTGSVVASFARPYPSICYGLAYYGEYLWISAELGYIFIVHCPGNVGVRPASLGRVKALFR